MVIDFAGNLAENRGGIPRTCPHFQHAIGRLEFQGLGHQGHDIGLRNRLPFLDGQCGVVVGELRHFGRNKSLARYFPESSQHGGISYPSLCKLAFDKFFARNGTRDHS